MRGLGLALLLLAFPAFAIVEFPRTQDGAIREFVVHLQSLTSGESEEGCWNPEQLVWSDATVSGSDVVPNDTVILKAQCESETGVGNYRHLVPPETRIRLLGMEVMALSTIAKATHSCDFVIGVSVSDVYSEAPGMVTLSDPTNLVANIEPADSHEYVQVGGRNGMVLDGDNDDWFSIRSYQGGSDESCLVLPADGVQLRLTYTQSKSFEDPPIPGGRARRTVMMLGSSNSVGEQDGVQGKDSYIKTMRSVLGGDWNAYVRGCGGSTVLDWAPGTHLQTACPDGSASGNLQDDFTCFNYDYSPIELYDQRVKRQVQNGPIIVSILLGVNEAFGICENVPVESAAYKTNLQAIIDEILSDCPGCQIVLNKPYQVSGMNAAALQRIIDYGTRIDELVAAYPRVYVGADLHAEFSVMPSVHPSAAEAITVGTLLANALIALSL